MKFLPLFAGILLFCTTAQAKSDITPEGFFGEWRVYTSKEGNETICFMVSAPQHSNAERNNNFLSITHRPYENSFDTIAVMFGTTFHKTSRPTIEIDNLKPVEMKAVEDTAFVRTTKEENQLIAEMIKGNVARTKGKSKKGTLLRETYSLKGFSKAYELINLKCRPQSTQNKNTAQNKESLE